MTPDLPPTPRFSAELERHLRTAAGTPARRHRRVSPLRAAVAVAAVVIALAFVIGPRVGDDDSDGGASSTDLPVLRLEVRDLLDADRAKLERLQEEFRRRGAVLAIRDRWVKNPKADGRIFSVRLPRGVGSRSTGRGARQTFDVPFKVDDKLPGPIVVVMGKAGGEKPKRTNATIYEAIPRLCDLVDPSDPKGTEQALRDAGFDVVVTGVPWETEGLKPIVISVLDGEGRYRNVDPDTKQLIMEVGTPGEGHTGTRDGSCM